MILLDVLAPSRLKRSVGTVHWFVDAANVIGSRPDGWWRDRPGATRRLIDAVKAWASAEDVRVTVVLDAGPGELARSDGAVDVVIAPRRGRDAADDEIARLIAGRTDARVVTSDAGLAARARAAGAQVEGAGSFRSRLAY
jgi:predicted RNA-binding protein with PIN domain